MALLLIVVAYPLVWLFLGSFKTQDEFLNGSATALPESFTNFDNYTTAWSSVAIYLRNSLLTVLPSLALIVILGTAAGFALEVLVWKGRQTTLLLFLADIMIPGR